MALHDSVFQVNVVTDLGGVLAQNKLTYTCAEGPFTNVSSQQFTDDLVDAIKEAWKACLQEDNKLLSITGRIDQKPPAFSYPPYTAYINEDGVRSGQSLPPYVTGVIFKYPNPETIFPETAEAFKLGRLEISGMSEIDQSSGYLEDSGISALAALGEAVESFESVVNSVPVEWLLMMYRLTPAGNASDNVLVAETSPSQRMGTRNSRKYRPNVWL